jgi:sister-chromatid-cohesion protein PDS5
LQEARPHAFRLAQALIKGNAQLLETPITEFMSDILVNVKASTSELKDHGHALIWELNKISPNLLLYVMPNLEKELTVEDEEKREDTVALLGKMFASDGSRMITSYPQLFNTFLKRFNDVEPSIRRRMVEYATEFIKNLPSLDLADNLFTRVRDTDEGVRSAAVKAICVAASANPIRFKKDVLQEVGMRMRDKKVPPSFT